MTAVLCDACSVPILEDFDIHSPHDPDCPRATNPDAVAACFCSHITCPDCCWTCHPNKEPL